jgi:hypothetical protein
MELRPVSPLPWPPWAGAKVGREAVVIFKKIKTTQLRKQRTMTTKQTTLLEMDARNEGKSVAIAH